jgi:hypothetical protein
MGTVLMVWGAFSVPGRRVGDYGVPLAELGNREFWVAIDRATDGWRQRWAAWKRDPPGAPERLRCKPVRCDSKS